MEATSMMKKIGTKIKRNFGGLELEVVIKDVKISYGNIRYLVTTEKQQTNSVWINA